MATEKTKEEMMHVITVRNQIFNNVEGAVLEMHEWDKEQFIKWAVKWVNDNYIDYLQPISYYDQLQNSIDINAFVNDFKKNAEEQL